MAAWTIECSLPYRVRASDRTYTVPTGSGADVQIELRTVEREEFDPRVGSGTNIEFVVDRFGWAAYSEVKARVDASDDREAVTRFLSALNNLIAQARDLFEIPWMHEVDQDDLFNLTVGNGKTVLVDFLDDRETAWGSTEFIVLRPKEPWPPEIAYVMARDPRFREHAIVNMTGTSGRQRVPAGAVSEYALTTPPDTVAVAFGDFVRPSFELSTRLGLGSRALAEQRDTLLPRLVAGELRLKSTTGDLNGAG